MHAALLGLYDMCIVALHSGPDSSHSNNDKVDVDLFIRCSFKYSIL